MTNHSYLYINNVSLKQITKDIDEINQRRFYNKLHIEYQKAPSKWNKKNKSDVIYISLEENDLGMWLNEDGVLEIRNQGYPEFKWIGVIILNELSVKYDALKGDDGVGIKWKGDLTKYNTYVSYLLLGEKSPGIFRMKWAIRIAEQVAKEYDCKAFTDEVRK